MLHQKHGGTEFQDQLLDLHPGEHIDIIQRFIPDIEVGRRDEAACDQHLFLLAFGEVLHSLSELFPSEIQFSEDRKQQVFPKAFRLTVIPEGSVQMGGILVYIRNHQTGPHLQGPFRDQQLR